MIAILVIAAKDLMLLLRDRAALLWIFVAPLVVALPLGAVVGGGGASMAPLAVLTLDLDDTAASRALLVSLDAVQGLKLSRVLSVEEGEAGLRARRAVALLVLRPGLEKALSARGPSAATPEGAPIEIHADPARRVEIAVLRGLVAEAAAANFVLPQPMELLSSLRAAAGVPGLPRVAVAPLADAPRLPPTPYARSIAAGMVWALIGAVAGFALMLSREGRAGTRLRLAAAPIAPIAVPLGKALALVVALSLSLLVLLAIGAVGLALRPTGGAALAIAYGAVLAPALGLAMLFSQCGRSDIAVSGIAWGAMLALALLAGAILPLHLLPDSMQAVAQASPLYWVMTALEGVLWRGQDWPDLWRPAGALGGLGLVSFAAGLFLFLGRRR